MSQENVEVLGALNIRRPSTAETTGAHSELLWPPCMV